jgi:hypothetical protein
VLLYGGLCFVLSALGKGAEGRAMVRGFGQWEVWTLPVMYTVFRDLRFLSIQVCALGKGR